MSDFETPAENFRRTAERIEKRGLKRAAPNVSVEEIEKLLGLVAGQVWAWVDRGVIPEPLVIELGGQRVHDVYGWPASIMHWWLWSQVKLGRTDAGERALPSSRWPGWESPAEEWLAPAHAAIHVGVEEKQLKELRRGVKGAPYLAVGQRLVRYPVPLLEAWKQAQGGPQTVEEAGAGGWAT